MLMIYHDFFHSVNNLWYINLGQSHIGQKIYRIYLYMIQQTQTKTKC